MRRQPHKRDRRWAELRLNAAESTRYATNTGYAAWVIAKARAISATRKLRVLVVFSNGSHGPGVIEDVVSADTAKILRIGSKRMTAYSRLLKIVP